MFERKKGNEEYRSVDIDKIAARGYVSSTPINIFITVHIKENKNKIAFKLHPNTVDTYALLSAHCNFLLGEDFPENMDSLDIELGGLGATFRLKNGVILVGDKKIPLSEVTHFAIDRNGFYNL